MWNHQHFVEHQHRPVTIGHYPYWVGNVDSSKIKKEDIIQKKLENIEKQLEKVSEKVEQSEQQQSFHKRLFGEFAIAAVSAIGAVLATLLVKEWWLKRRVGMKEKEAVEKAAN